MICASAELLMFRENSGHYATYLSSFKIFLVIPNLSKSLVLSRLTTYKVTCASRFLYYIQRGIFLFIYLFVCLFIYLF